MSSTQVNLRSAPVLNPGKATYFKKQAISTILGGFQFSDEESGIDLSYAYQAIQFLLYILFPLVVFICGIISSADDFVVSGIVPAIINLILNTIIQILGRQAHQKLNENRLLSSESTREFSMIIKAKSLPTMIISILLLAAVSFFTGNFIAKAPIGVQILTLINAFVTFFSLVGGSPSEFSAMISDNADPFTRHSTALMRPMYLLICLIINLAINSTSNQTTFHVIVPLLTLIYSLGLLSSVYTTLIYAIEKFNMYILGAAESTATDLRLVLQTTIQVLVVFIIALIAHSSYEKAEILNRIRFITLISSILALLLSMNFLFKLNVFSSKVEMQSTKLFYLIANKLVLLIASIVLPIVFSQDSFTSSTGRITCIISLILVILNHIFQESQSAYFSSRLTGLSSIAGRILNVISQIIYIAAISQISVNANQMFGQYTLTGLSSDSLSRVFIQTALIYRLFRSVYANPLITGISLSEIVIYAFIWDDSVVQLVIYSPLIHAVNIAISNLFRRLVIWIYSILKMNSSKKQTISSQFLFNILSFTLLLPVNLLGIALSSALDTPFLPALGLPLYFAGFPRPKRFWPDVKRVVRDAGESLLYEKFLDNFQDQFASILRKRNAQVGEFFLIRIEKYLATVQILEVGQNYVVIQMKGLESQEMTSCHSIEANQIDRIVEETFVKKICFFSDCLGSLKPIQQFDVKAYEENQLQFTGIITDSSFVKGYREILLKLITYFVNSTLSLPQDQQAIDALLSTYSDYVLNQTNHKTKYPSDFAKLINFNLSSPKNNIHTETIQKIKQSATHNSGSTSAAVAAQKPQQKQQQQQKQFNLDEDLNDLFGPKKQTQAAPAQQSTSFPIQQKQQQQPNTYTKPVQKQQEFGIPLNSEQSYKQSPQFEKPSPHTQVPHSTQNNNIFNNPNTIKPVKPLANNNNNNNNDLDDLLDGLSIKSTKAKKQDPIKSSLIEPPAPKPQHFPVIPTANQTNALSNAANTVAQQQNQQNNLFSKNQMEMQQFTIKPKKDDPSLQSDDLDDYLSSMLKDEPKQKNIQKDQPSARVAEVKLDARPVFEEPKKQVLPPLARVEEQKKPIQNNNDELDDFLNGLVKDLDDDTVHQKVSAPPMKNTIDVHLGLADDEFNNITGLEQFADQKMSNPHQKLNRDGAQSQSNTRISGERSLKDSGYDNSKSSSADEERAMKLVYLLFSLCTNDSNCDKSNIDQELLFKHFKDSKYAESIRGVQSATAKAHDLSKLLYIMNRSVRYAIKIAYDQFAYMGSAEDVSSEDVLEAITENEKECSIGMGAEAERSEAIKKELPCLWSLHYTSSANPLSIFRSQFKPINCTIFNFDSNLVQSIWANLVFELYYATNDDDERYSIQTHEQFFRNLIIQNAEEPLGYAPFYSGPTLLQY